MPERGRSPFCYPSLPRPGALVNISYLHSPARPNIRSSDTTTRPSRRAAPKAFHQLNRVHPRGVLVTGTFSRLTQPQQDSFNQFRHSLYSLTVITYDELLRRLRVLYGIAEAAEDDSSEESEPDDIPF